MDELKLTAAQQSALLAAWNGPTGVVLVRGQDVELFTAPETTLKTLVSMGLLAWRKQQPGHWPAAKLTDEGYRVAAGLANKERR